jgi:hypothetical protein
MTAPFIVDENRQRFSSAVIALINLMNKSEVRETFTGFNQPVLGCRPYPRQFGLSVKS